MKLQELFETIDLEEGVDDPHIFKAVLLMGAPGSGKSTIGKKITSGSGLRSVNSDDFIKTGVSSHDVRRMHSANLLDMYVNGRLGLLVDGTGQDLGRIVSVNNWLRRMGYDTKVIYIQSTLETALSRNIKRDRVEDPEYIARAHSDITQNLPAIVKSLGGYEEVIVVDNNNDSQWDEIKAWKEMQKWISKPPSSEEALKWIEKERIKKAKA